MLVVLFPDDPVFPSSALQSGTLVPEHYSYTANQGTPSIKMSAEPHWLPTITSGPSYALGTHVGVTVTGFPSGHSCLSCSVRTPLTEGLAI